MLDMAIRLSRRPLRQSQKVLFWRTNVLGFFLDHPGTLLPDRNLIGFDKDDDCER